MRFVPAVGESPKVNGQLCRVARLRHEPEVRFYSRYPVAVPHCSCQDKRETDSLDV